MSDNSTLSIHDLRTSLKPFAKPETGRAAWQTANTVVPYFVLWGALVFLLKNGVPYIFLVPLLILGGLLLVRIFILFHDCAHGSFFPSQRANDLLGHLTGFLTFTPFTYWKRNHLIHHGTYANLDRRGVGDMWTLTVNEYRALSPAGRLAYRLYRNPLVFLGIGPGYTFLLTQRFLYGAKVRQDWLSVTLTNAVIVLTLLAAWLTIGIPTFVLIQLPILLIAGAAGVWLFYVQHQFEGVYWAHQEDWDPVRAALDGSSYYKLPKVLQWFTGNIGQHHVHHVLPRIPNYRLQASYDATPALQKVSPLTFMKSLGSLRLNLWDEERQRLVSFGSLSG